jgi:hypothetical protein
MLLLLVLLMMSLRAIATLSFDENAHLYVELRVSWTRWPRNFRGIHLIGQEDSLLSIMEKEGNPIDITD